MKKEKSSQKKLDDSLKALAKSAAAVFIILVLSKLFVYLYRVIIARYFGPELYGVFSLLIVISGWVIAFSTLGLSDGLLRYVPFYRGKKEQDKINYLFRFSMIALLFSSIISGILLYLFSDIISISLFHNIELSFFLKVFSFFLPISTIAYLLVSVIRGYEKIMEYVALYNLLPNVSRFVFLLFFIYLGLSGGAIVFSFCLGIFTMLVAASLLCKYKIPELLLKSKLPEETGKELKRELFRYSLPVLFFGLISTLFYWIDSLCLAYFKSATEVGIYNAAVTIAMLLGMTSDLFNQLFFPLIIREYSKNNISLIKNLSKTITKWIFMINLPFFILMIFFPGAIINLLFGVEYLAAENSLRILLVGSLFASLASVSNQLLYMMGKSKAVLYDLVIVSAINIVLNLILIPQQVIFGIQNTGGLVGASIATLVSVLTLNLIFVIQAKIYTSIIPIKRKMIRILFILLVPFLLLFYIQGKASTNLIFVLAITVAFLLLYILMLVVFKGLDNEDTMIIKTFFNKLKSLKDLSTAIKSKKQHKTKRIQ
jgi:O-antigen/teichoic acid export membrane protein